MPWLRSCQVFYRPICFVEIGWKAISASGPGPLSAQAALGLLLSLASPTTCRKNKSTKRNLVLLRIGFGISCTVIKFCHQWNLKGNFGLFGKHTLFFPPFPLIASENNSNWVEDNRTIGQQGVLHLKHKKILIDLWEQFIKQESVFLIFPLHCVTGFKS